MASLTIVYWRDIPAQVIAKRGREAAKVQLSERFETAIDRAAMRAGLTGTDAYLGEWRRGEAAECGEDLKAEVDKAALGLEAEFTEERLGQLVRAGGRAEA
ncbi:MAG: virulence factor [Proteobacteria bacterium]|nr:virulence factor [Pseudomonadota bacterium]MBI3499167.1 virulence factor [Pseudomonadota bacterium]